VLVINANFTQHSKVAIRIGIAARCALRLSAGSHVVIDAAAFCVYEIRDRRGERSATGALSKAGSRTLRWAAVEAATQGWRPSSPWHAHHQRVSARHGKNPAKSSVARKLLIAAWHMLSRGEPFKPPALAAGRTLPRRAPAAF
jgi:hypothetical protein